MARYIDIDKMNRLAYSLTAINNEIYYANGGAEDVAPVVHARWEYDEFSHEMICSNCWYGMTSNTKDYNYCHYCGAKMDKE